MAYTMTKIFFRILNRGNRSCHYIIIIYSSICDVRCVRNWSAFGCNNIYVCIMLKLKIIKTPAWWYV